MKNFKMIRKCGFGKWVAVLCVISFAVSVLAVIISRAMEQRLVAKLSRCADSLQRAIPTMEEASQLYIDAQRTPKEKPGEDDLPF